MRSEEVPGLIKVGLDAAIADYQQIAMAQHHDVKPKEDQIKCCLYKAFKDAGRLVHTEAAYHRNGGRCDLMVLGDPTVGIEIKTAWAAPGWQNKLSEQVQDWLTDIEKLKANKDAFGGWSSYFVLLVASQDKSTPQTNLLEKLAELQGQYPCEPSAPCKIEEWNGLNTLQYFVFKIT